MLGLLQGTAVRIVFAVVLAAALGITLATGTFTGGATPAAANQPLDGYGGCGTGYDNLGNQIGNNDSGDNNCEDKLLSQLRPGNVVPGPGQADASGRALLTINEKKRRICIVADFSNLTGPITALELHRGVTRVNGATVALFGKSGSADSVARCEDGMKLKLLRSIEKTPAGFYLLVETSGRPNGALRGQLDHAL